jgi:hypothetical protein
MRCNIPFETLADYHDGRADATAADRIREHLGAGCAHCRESLAWLGRTLETVAEAERVRVPPSLVDRLHGLYAERFRPPIRRSLLARLSFDGRSAPALAGARGAEEEAFRLNYSTEEHDIDLWQEPSGQGDWYLIGQVLSREGDDTVQPARIVLTSTGGPEVSVTPELPEFHLPSVPAGIYRAALLLPDGEIVIPELVVGRP